MTEGLPNSFLYEHCDVPDGESLATWKRRQTHHPQRRAQITGGFLAAFATLAPLVLSVRGRAAADRLRVTPGARVKLRACQFA